MSRKGMTMGTAASCSMAQTAPSAAARTSGTGSCSSARISPSASDARVFVLEQLAQLGGEVHRVRVLLHQRQRVEHRAGVPFQSAAQRPEGRLVEPRESRTGKVEV